MQIYHYDPGTGLLVGSGVADPSPREPGVWLVPAYATAVAPPAIPEGKVAVWGGSSWSLITAPPPNAPPPETPEELTPRVINRRQCAAEMFSRALITGPEAVAMTATATPPAMVEAMIAALSEPAQTMARIDFAATSYERSNALLIALMTGTGADADDIDDFFRAAAAR